MEDQSAFTPAVEWRPECLHDRDKALQMAREGKACEWFFHITHSGGSTLTELASKNGKAARRDVDLSQCTSHSSSTLFKNHQESALKGPLDTLVPCHRDDFVSIIVVRDPLSRVLSGDGMWQTKPENNFANLDKCHADNYGLRKLIGKEVADGPLNSTDLEFAQRRLSSFDVIIDLNDYTNSAKQLCAELGWKNCAVKQKNHRDPKEIMPADIYSQLQEKNKFEIAFYDYARRLAAARLHESPMQAKSMSMNKESHTEQNADQVELNEDAAEKWICKK